MTQAGEAKALNGTADFDAPDVAAFERLEERILALVEQLREERRRGRAAQEEIESLRARVVDRERQIERLGKDQSQAETARREVRDRIESLLTRLESIEE